MDYDIERWIDPEATTRSKEEVRFEATPAEMDALAKRFGLLSLKNFRFEITVSHGHEKGTYVLVGSLDADVVQACVSSLKPVPEQVHDEFEVILAPEGYDIPDDEDEDWDDDIEIILPKGVNIGEIAAQYLSMSLNPFPRAEDGKIADLNAKNVDISTEEEDTATRNPFHVLKNLNENG